MMTSSSPLMGVTATTDIVTTLLADLSNNGTSNAADTSFNSTTYTPSLESVSTSDDVIAAVTQSTQLRDIIYKDTPSTEWTPSTTSLIPDVESQTWNDSTKTFPTLHSVEATYVTAEDVGADTIWNAADGGISANGTVAYSIVATLATVAILAAVITLIARRVSRLLDTGNGLYLSSNHVTGGASSYVSVGGDSPTSHLDWFYAELNSSSSCWCCVCRLCSLCRCHCVRASYDDQLSAAGNKYDYIYRPLGGVGSGNGSSRIEDEYETTFVGVSIPLLHEVSDI